MKESELNKLFAGDKISEDFGASNLNIYKDGLKNSVFLGILHYIYSF